MTDNNKQFENFKKGHLDKNSVWYYFLREKCGDSAKCKNCGREIKTAGGSTSGLHTHLRTSHNINLLKRNSVEVTALSSTASATGTSQFQMPESGGSGSKSKIYGYFTNNKDDNTLPMVLAKMTAVDGFSFRVFVTSIELRKSLIARGFQVPKSAESVRTIVMKYANKIRGIVVNELTNLQQKGTRFSLTFDEWTSVKNRRYLNVNVHSRNRFWNLGLERVHKSLPAEACVKLIDDKLKEHKLKIDRDIICITTDGASVMRKVGRLIAIDHQLCLAHGLQLAVVDVLYAAREYIQQVEENATDNYSESEEEYDDDEFASDSELNEVPLDGLLIYQNSSDSQELEINLASLISKVRMVVKLFRRSPTKNYTLQVYVKVEFGKELSLILDTKTRWNSLLFMLERFYKLKNCILKALIDLKSTISLTESEFEVILSTVSTLLPVKLAVEALCRRDATLLSADATLAFMIQHLGEGPFADKMKSSLVHRIKERRTKLFSLMQYLHKGNQAQSIFGSDIAFDRLTKTEMVNMIVHLIKRLSPITFTGEASDSKSASEEDEVVTCEGEDEPKTSSLQEQMDKAINNEHKNSTEAKKSNNQRFRQNSANRICHIL